MPESTSSGRRYDASKRLAAADANRRLILQAAQTLFEERGWAGTTMGAVATLSGSSIKTVEAQFKTKGQLLGAVVDYAIRGDHLAVPLAERESVTRMREAVDAPSFLVLHAHHIRIVQERSARVLAVVEHAATSDERVAEVWSRIAENRRSGTERPAAQLVTLPGCRPGLTPAAAATVFWLTTDWAYWRSLHDQRGMSPAEIEAWTADLYASLLL